MPYISKELRAKIGNVNLIDPKRISSPGELNYAITKVIDTYLNTKGLSYSAINDILGALEGAKLEFYRRVAVPYENTKIATNGDVYEKRDPKL